MFLLTFLASCLQGLRFHRFSYGETLSPKLTPKFQIRKPKSLQVVGFPVGKCRKSMQAAENKKWQKQTKRVSNKLSTPVEQKLVACSHDRRTRIVKSVPGVFSCPCLFQSALMLAPKSLDSESPSQPTVWVIFHDRSIAAGGWASVIYLRDWLA